MRVCIHRGTKEIGGTCVELEVDGWRLVLDVGLPLDWEPEKPLALPPVPGFDRPDKSLVGVVISHPHADHYGLASRLPAETPFLVGEAAENILAAADVFTRGLKLANTTHLRDSQPIERGPFTVTPFLIDHSAYDSYAVLVEAGGRRLFYTGDFRAHGRKAALFERLVSRPPPDVDVLLMEGTTIGRPPTGKTMQTEDELVGPMADLFDRTPGLPLVWASAQNIDRLVTVWKACVRSGRKLILDMYAAHILKSTDNPRLPQANWTDIRVFLPSTQRSRIVSDKQFAVSREYRDSRIYENNLAAVASDSVMLFRPSMCRDLERAGCLSGARVICSIWSGLLKQERQQWFLDWLTRHGVPLDHCHTSGHAAVEDLQRLRNAFAGTPVVPVHTEHPDRFEELFGNVLECEDGVWWEVKRTR